MNYNSRQKNFLIGKFIGDLLRSENNLDRNTTRDNKVIETMERLICLSIKTLSYLDGIDTHMNNPDSVEIAIIKEKRKITKTEIDSKKPHLQQAIKDLIVKDLLENQLLVESNTRDIFLGEKKLVSLDRKNEAKEQDQKNLITLEEIAQEEIEVAIKLARSIKKLLR